MRLLVTVRSITCLLALTAAALPPTGCIATAPTPVAAPAMVHQERPADADFPLTRRRRAFRTEVFFDRTDRAPAVEPPSQTFTRVRYRAALGSNVAYVSPRRGGARRPAIVWVAGGFDWSIGADAWLDAPRANDQSARAFRDAGLVLMLPALRGSHDNPGRNECFLGEVDDILAAADYLAARDDVDPRRIYLGGHSTGGTIALLAAASSDRFRAVFAFGPVADPRQYGDQGCLSPDVSDEEARLRAPVEFIHDIRTPTLVIEGAERGNAGTFGALEQRRGAAPLRFVVVPGADHFSVLAPGSEVVARAILADTDPTPRLDVTVDGIMHALSR
jgi:dipeptidyl aminopeptidase/acylaminoacyl peptidase